MKTYAIPDYENGRRLGLLRQVLEKDAAMTCDSLTQGGSDWGNRTNTALMCLVRQMLTDVIQNERNSLDKVELLVDDYLKVDLRIFTLEAQGVCTCSKLPALREEMVQKSIEYAVPVLREACKQDREVYRPLVDILRDGLFGVGFPNIYAGDYTASIAI